VIFHRMKKSYKKATVIGSKKDFGLAQNYNLHSILT
jgi:hypothetical protein